MIVKFTVIGILLFCNFTFENVYTSFISFDEQLELSQWGNNRTIDMLVGDIYGGMDCSKVQRIF